MLFDVERCRFDKARVVDDDGAAAIEHFESVAIKADALRLASIVREKGCYFKKQSTPFELTKIVLYSDCPNQRSGIRSKAASWKTGNCCQAAFELRPHHLVIITPRTFVEHVPQSDSLLNFSNISS